MTTHVQSLLALLAAATLASPVLAAGAAPAAKPDLARGQELSTTVCQSCHVNDGSRGAPTFPILQGQHPAYIVKQLTEFKADKRENAIMKPFSMMLSEADARSVAAFYGAKKAPAPGEARNKDHLALGQKIYRSGIADRAVPACAGCHSPTGAGIPAQYPRLAGQHPDYAEAQLKAFRDGVRKNNAVMTGVAAKLTDKEIAAVSDYLATMQ